LAAESGLAADDDTTVEMKGAGEGVFVSQEVTAKESLHTMKS